MSRNARVVLFIALLAAGLPGLLVPAAAEPEAPLPRRGLDDPTRAEAGRLPRRDTAADPAPAFGPSTRVIPFTGGAGKVVLHIRIDGTIDLGLAPFVQRVVEAAGKRPEVLAIVTEMDTPGGRVDAAVRIKDALLESKKPTVVFIHSQAISAGALIAYAHDFIVVSQGATMGAATPIQLGQGGEAQPVGEKVVSYMRGVMRSTAEAKGRNGDVAEAMVDATLEVPGVSAKDKLLTLDRTKALAIGVADLHAESLEEVLSAMRLDGATVEELTPNWAENVARVLTDPVISGMLMTFGFLGLLIELYTPGFGIAGIIGLTGLVLFFLGHYIVMLAGLEELLLLLAGLILLALEMFVIPGFGIAGILGIAAVGVALVLMLTGLPVEVSWEAGMLTEAIVTVLVSFVATVVLLVLFTRFFPRTRASRRLVLGTTMAQSDGYQSFDDASASRLLGQSGLALTILRPSGRGDFGGQQLDVVTRGEFVSPGTPIEVIKVEGANVIVRACQPHSGEQPPKETTP